MTPHIVTLMLGISTAMEQENSESEDFDDNSINNIKTALMGPLSGIGDSFFWGTLRLIATGIGTALSLKGNILGPIMFLLIFNIPHIIIRYLLVKLGYKLGIEFLTKLEKTRAMEKLTFGASILGLIVIGAMAARMIEITIPLSLGSGDNAIGVQGILNDIMPGLLQLGTFGAVYYLSLIHISSFCISRSNCRYKICCCSRSISSDIDTGSINFQNGRSFLLSVRKQT